MRSGRIIWFLILLLPLVMPWACAQSPPPSLEAFFEGGGSFLNGGRGELAGPCVKVVCGPEGPCQCPPTLIPVTDSFSKTARVATGARYRFTPHDALEASYSYSPNHFTIQPVGLSAAASYNRVDVVSFNYVHYLSGKSRVQPFLTAGLGIKRFSGPSNASAIVGGYVNKAYLSQFAWNYGGGTDLVLQRHLALRLELRDYVSGQPTVITGTGQNITGTSHNIVPSVGIVFRF